MSILISNGHSEATTRRTTFTAIDADGKRYQWSFWKHNGIWWLRTNDDCFRALESTWLASVPRIHAVLDNYGMTAEIS